MRQIFVTLVVLLLTGLPSFADKAEDLSKVYRRLCQIQGHFQGGPDWVASVDSWGGEKHKVMSELGELLGQPGGDAKRILVLLGDPQKTTPVGPGQFPVEFGSQERVLCYHWRGGHDFLYFIVSTDPSRPKVHKSGWWMAGE